VLAPVVVVALLSERGLRDEEVEEEDMAERRLVSPVSQRHFHKISHVLLRARARIVSACALQAVPDHFFLLQQSPGKVIQLMTYERG